MYPLLLTLNWFTALALGDIKTLPEESVKEMNSARSCVVISTFAESIGCSDWFTTTTV